MKAGSQYFVALRLLNTVDRFCAQLTINSRTSQIHLYCVSERIIYVEDSGQFPAAWLSTVGMADAAAALREAGNAKAKAEAFVPILERDDVRNAFGEAVRKELHEFFRGEITECKMKADLFKADKGVLTLTELHFDYAKPFVDTISTEELIPNNAVSFKQAGDYINKTTRFRIGPQEGYLLSRLEHTLPVADILSTVPGDEATTKRSLLTLWAFGVLDSPFLSQLLPKVVAQEAGKEATAPPPAAAKEKAKAANEDSPEQLVELINQTYQNLSRKDYYSLLSITTRAGLDEIKTAYYKLARKFHPDRFYGIEDPVVKEKVDIIFSAINVAYETLKSANRRVEYDNAPLDKKTPAASSLRTEAKSGTPSKDMLSKMAEEHAKNAQRAYEDGKYYEAVQFLKSAVQISPDIPRYWRQLGVSLSRNPQWRKEAEESLGRAIELEPKNPENHLYMGFLYKSSGLKLRAKRHFNACLELDPGNENAARELNLIEEEEMKPRSHPPQPQQPTPPPKKGGLLGGIFKKK